MKKRLILLCYFPFLLFSAPAPEALPWIKAEDTEAINFAEPFLPKNPVIIEAGVCDAEDTHRMKARWPQATIYGFEPHPELFKRAITETKTMKGVTVYPYALFDRVGTIRFYMSGHIPGASSLLEDNIRKVKIPSDLYDSGRNYEDVAVTVSCTTLDRWAKENGVSHVDYIWLDTEGAELPILRNAKEILPSVRVISVEANFQEFRRGMTQFADLYDFLEEEEFVLKYIWGRSDWQGVAVFVNKAIL